MTSDNVTRFLVSGESLPLDKLLIASDRYANWVEGRANHFGTSTWMVTVMDGEYERFVNSARVVGDLTLQTIDWTDPGVSNGYKSETYTPLMGNAGWHVVRKCPECIIGKHPNCSGHSWCDECDAEVACPCPEGHP